MGLRFLALGGIAIVATLAVSYYSAQYFLASPRFEAVDGASLDEADRLRGYSNELVQLTGLYLDRVGPGSDSQDEDAARWLEYTFRPRLNDLRQRLLHSEVENGLLDAVIEAANTVNTMALRPGEAAPRKQAALAVLSVHDGVEGHISAIGAGEDLRTAPLMPSFR